MTKCTIIGDTTLPTKKPTPIQFIKRTIGDVATGGKWMTPTSKPEDWKNIELISGISRKNNRYKPCYDIMFAYDDDRSNGVVILGF
jgi:hypothetical protein